MRWTWHFVCCNKFCWLNEAGGISTGVFPSPRVIKESISEFNSVQVSAHSFTNYSIKGVLEITGDNGNGCPEGLTDWQKTDRKSAGWFSNFIRRSKEEIHYCERGGYILLSSAKHLLSLYKVAVKKAVPVLSSFPHRFPVLAGSDWQTLCLSTSLKSIRVCRKYNPSKWRVIPK